MYMFFEMYLWILVFRVLMNLSATTDFPSLCVEYISISLSFNHFSKIIVVKSATFMNPYFVWFASFGLALLSIRRQSNIFEKH